MFLKCLAVTIVVDELTPRNAVTKPSDYLILLEVVGWRWTPVFLLEAG